MDRASNSNSTIDPAAVPLCVDLDGTLVRSDTLWETILQLAKRRPGAIVPLIGRYLSGGRSAFKSAAVDALVIDPAALPYHDDVLAEIRRARAGGRPVLLVTGANERLAQAVADHVGLFDGVIGSRLGSNNTGQDKADELSRRYGLRRFDYFGNSHADLKVWAQSHAALVIGSSRLKEQAGQRAPVAFHAPAATVGRGRAILQALRPLCWPLDFLVVLPSLAVGHVGRITITAFIGVWGIAAAFRILGELTDLPAFRKRPDSARHPFAAGNLPLSQGVGMVVASFLIGCTCFAFAPWDLLPWVGGFVAASLARAILCRSGSTLDRGLAVVQIAIRLAIGTLAAG